VGALRKRSLVVAGHSTSLALEPEFWNALEDAAEARSVTLVRLLADIDETRSGRSLASACRVAALKFAAEAPPKASKAG